MKKFCAFAMALAMLMSLYLSISALSSGSEQSDGMILPQTKTLANVDTDAFETDAERDSSDKKGKDVDLLRDILGTNNYKQNIFNNILNSVDYYDAVEGALLTTLWREDGEPTFISYGSDINAQRSYQKITSIGNDCEVFVADGKKYTFDETNRTSKIEKIIGHEDEVAYRTKQTGNIYSVATINVKDKAARVGVKDGIPIYYYRNDLTNCDYAAVSIFPQTLAFGLLANYNDWDVVDAIAYLGRDAVVVVGSIADEVYRQKINSETFKLVIDVETGIVLEFAGYNNAGNETETIRTTAISIIKNTLGKSTDIATFVEIKINEIWLY